MAIKGKGRARSRRVIAAPPRPQLVVRKPPIWRRRWVLVTVAVLALAGIAFGVRTALDRKHHREFRAREITAAEAFSAKLKVTFPTDVQTVPPDLVVFYPSLRTNLDKLAKGQLKPADAKTQADGIVTSAQKAATAISGLNVSQLISARFTVTGVPTGSSGSPLKNIAAPGATQHELLEAQFLMTQAFQLWVQAGTAMNSAAEATGAQIQALVDQAKKLDTQAGALFDRGYQRVLAIQNALGLTSSNASAQPAPVPGA